jgi:hypothetical protein
MVERVGTVGGREGNFPLLTNATTLTLREIVGEKSVMTTSPFTLLLGYFLHVNGQYMEFRA